MQVEMIGLSVIIVIMKVFLSRNEFPRKYMLKDFLAGLADSMTKAFDI